MEAAAHAATGPVSIGSVAWESFTLGLRAPDEQRQTLEVAPSTARVRRANAAAHEMDEAATLDLLLG